MMKKLTLGCILVCFAIVCLQAQSLTIVSGPTVTYLSDSSAMLMVVVSDNPDRSSSNKQTIQSFQQLDDYLFNLALENKLDEFHYDKSNVSFVDGFGTIKIRLSKARSSVQQVSQSLGDFKVVINSGFLYPRGTNSRKASNQIIQQMNNQRPRAVLWMGNTLYYPMEDAGKYEQQYTKNIDFRQDASVSQLLQNSSHFAIWNNRDFAPEHWDNAAPDREAAAKLFQSFWPAPESATPKAGIYKHTRMEDCEFLMLDHLYFSEGGPLKLGAHQLFWLKEKLYKSTANFKFIVSGTSFLNDASNVAQLEEKQEIMDFIRNNGITGVVFLNSAMPYTELSVLNSDDFYPLYEFSCASLTNLGIPIEVQKNSLRINKTLVKKANFGLVSIKEEGGQRFCWLESFDQNGGLLWTYPINLKTLQK